MKVRYIGPDGGLNNRVASATGGSAEMEHGKVYDVEKELGVKLADGIFFEAVVKDSKEAADGKE